MSTVSVIITSYNIEKYIEQAVDSVLKQTFQDIEIIVVDDGSTDTTLNILTGIAEKESRVSVVAMPHTGMPGALRNIGIAKASGAYICFLDGDDLYYPERIKRCMEAFRKAPGLNLVFHDLDLLCFNGEIAAKTYLRNADFYEKYQPYIGNDSGDGYLVLKNFHKFMLMYYAAFHTNTIMIKADYIHKGNFKFAEDMACCEDTDFWLRVAEDQDIGFIKDALSVYRMREHSVTQDNEVKITASIEMLTRNRSLAERALNVQGFKAYLSRLARENYELGYLLFSKGENDLSRKAYINSLSFRKTSQALAGFLKTYMPRSIVDRYREWVDH